MREDRRLKRCLVLQSFCPLFILLLIKHADHGELVVRFLKGLLQGDLSVFAKVAYSPALWDVLITGLSFVWFIVTVLVAIGFRNL